MRLEREPSTPNSCWQLQVFNGTAEDVCKEAIRPPCPCDARLRYYKKVHDQKKDGIPSGSGLGAGGDVC